MFMKIAGRVSTAVAVLAIGTVAARAQNLVSVTLDTDSVVGGSTVRGNAKLDAAAGVGGVAVDLVSDNTAKAAVPAQVLVKAGTRNKAFNVLTQTVLSTVNVTISASMGGPSVTDTLEIVPGGLTEIFIDLDLCSLETGAGTVKLSAAATFDTAVALRSSNPAVATVPATVSVLTGNQVSEIFDIDAGTVAVDTPVSIRARLGNAIRIDTVTVHVDSPSLTINVLKANLTPSSNVVVTVTYSDLSVEVVNTDGNGDAVFVNVIKGAATYTADPPGVAGPFGPFNINISACEPTTVQFITP